MMTKDEGHDTHGPWCSASLTENISFWLDFSSKQIETMI